MISMLPCISRCNYVRFFRLTALLLEANSAYRTSILKIATNHLFDSEIDTMPMPMLSPYIMLNPRLALGPTSQRGGDRAGPLQVC